MKVFSLERIQAVRVALSILVAGVITQFFSIREPAWVMITIVFIAQPSIGATLSRSKHRAMSTILGVLAGGLLSIVMHHILWVNALVGITCVFLGTYFLINRYDIYVFFLSIIIILILGFASQHVWIFVYDRIIDTLLGIVIFFVFTVLFFPITAHQFLRRDLLRTITHLRQLIEVSFSHITQRTQKSIMGIGRARADAISSVIIAHKHFEDLTYEYGLFTLTRTSSYAMIAQFEKIFASVYALESIAIEQYRATPQLKDIFAQLEQVFYELIETLEALIRKPKARTEVNYQGSQLMQVSLANLPTESTPALVFIRYNLESLTNDLEILYHSCYCFATGQQL